VALSVLAALGLGLSLAVLVYCVDFNMVLLVMWWC
jgi:hypothetical protein